MRNRLIALFAVTIASGAHAENLAIGRPLTWTRAPNYARCTDAGDARQLTDGARARSAHIWLDRACVGWETQPGDVLGLVIDLGRTCRIDSVVVHSAWFPPSEVLPPAALVATGETADRFATVGAREAPQQQTASRTAQPVAITVPTPLARGRFVLVTLLHQTAFCFADEIEVHGEPATKDAQRATASVAEPFALADLSRQAGAQRRAWAAARGLSAYAGTTETERFAARARAWRDQSRAALTVRRVDPWAPRTPWSDLQAGESDTLDLWPGAWGAIAIEIANAAPDSMYAAVRAGAAPAGAPALVAREVLYVEARDNQWSGDALPLARPKIALAPGQVRQIWFDVDARRATPGFYTQTVQAGDRAVAIPVRVHAVRADSTSLAALNWTYPEKYALTRTHVEEAIEDNRAHGIDSWCFPADAVPWPDPAAIAEDGHLLRAPDFTACDRQLDLHDAVRARRLFFFWQFEVAQDDPSRGRFRHRYGSTPWRRAVAEWLDLWMTHLASRGIDTTRVYMQPFDETTAPAVRRCFAMLRTMRPRVRLALTVTRAATLSSLRALDDDLDLAIVEREALPALDAWIVNATHRGREVWVYDVFEPGKSVPPYAYRALVWEAWARGLSGVAFWAYGDDGERSADVWNDFDGTRTDFHVVYGRTGAPVALQEPLTPSKRWQSFRIGRCEAALLESAAAHSSLRAQSPRAFANDRFDARPLIRRWLASQ